MHELDDQAEEIATLWLDGEKDQASDMLRAAILKDHKSMAGRLINVLAPQDFFALSNHLANKMIRKP